MCFLLNHSMLNGDMHVLWQGSKCLSMQHSVMEAAPPCFFFFIYFFFLSACSLTTYALLTFQGHKSIQAGRWCRLPSRSLPQPPLSGTKVYMHLDVVVHIYLIAMKTWFIYYCHSFFSLGSLIIVILFFSSSSSSVLSYSYPLASGSSTSCHIL